MSLNPDHEALRDRLRYGRLTENDRRTLTHLLEQVRAATTLTEESSLVEDQSIGFWWGTMAEYRKLVPSSGTQDDEEKAWARHVACVRCGRMDCSGHERVAGCGCREIGPLLTAPGTSGRDWRCDTCGYVWPGHGGGGAAHQQRREVDR